MEKTSLNIDENLEALLAYSLWFISGVVLLFTEKRSKFVRFHAAQSTVVFTFLTILLYIFGYIPIIGVYLYILTEIASIILWLILMIKAYQMEMWELPVVSDIAKVLMEKIR